MRNVFGALRHTLIVYSYFVVKFVWFPGARRRPEIGLHSATFHYVPGRAARHGAHRWTQRSVAHPALCFSPRGLPSNGNRSVLVAPVFAKYYFVLIYELCRMCIWAEKWVFCSTCRKRRETRVVPLESRDRRHSNGTGRISLRGREG